MAVQEPQPSPQPDPDDAPRPLLLPSLEVKNFRAFRHLTIEKLGRVNLITGKNNVGKTSLLEALWLYAERGSPAVIRKLINIRDVPVDEHALMDALRSLLNEGPNLEQEVPPVVIASPQRPDDHFAIHIEELAQIDNEDGPFVLAGAPQYGNPAREAFEIDWHAYIQNGKRQSSPLRLESILLTNYPFILRSTYRGGPRSHFVSTNGLDKQQIGTLWDGIALTDLQNDVLVALQIVQVDVIGVNLIGDKDAPNGRVPVVRRTKSLHPLPLRSLGEGMNRLFGVILAMVNARDGFLLLDEVENGLHYSILPDVWRLIFQTARRLNVQVFATTHSWDCIEAFQQAAAEDDDPGSGVLVRLDNRDGNVSATVFDERRLAIVTRDGIEVR